MTDPRWRRDLPVARKDLSADVDAELSFHHESLVQDLIRAGMSPEDARGEATRRLGPIPRVRRELMAIDRRRERRSERSRILGDFGSDLRFAARTLRKNWRFTGTAVISLGLGIGAAATMLSAAHSILIRSLPYEQAGQLVAIYSGIPARNLHGSNISYEDYLSWREQNRSFADIGMWTWSTVSLSGGQDAERVETALVTANLFPVLGVNPVLGRHFTDDEARANGPKVVLLGHGLWTRRYGADRAVVGKAITVDGLPHTVVGVMPRGFAFPDRGQAWTPLARDPVPADRGNRSYAGAIGRLRPAVGLEEARSDLATISKRLEAEFPGSNHGWIAEAISLRDDLVGDLRKPLQIFLAASFFVLLIVCANVANLMLARGADRERELAVRIAIGAGRRRVIRQLLTESVVLALLGGVLGTLLAVGGLRLFRFAFPGDVPFYVRLGIDGTALGLTLAVSLLTGILCGSAPALKATGVQLGAALKEGGRGGDGVDRSRFRRGLVVTEFALSFALLLGAGLLIRSYRRLVTTDLGFSRAGVLTARISLPSAKYAEPERIATFYRELFERLRSIPGVLSVGSAQGIPFSGWNVQSDVAIEGRPARDRGDELDVHVQFVSPGYFPTIEVPVVRGRGLAETDRDSLEMVGVINETLARREFAGVDPIGKRVRFGAPSSEGPWVTIVGVIGDFRHYRLPEPTRPAIYLPYLAYPLHNQTVVLRGGSPDPYTMGGPLRAVLRELDPDVPAYAVQSLDDAVSRSLWRQRLQGQTLSIFAGLALILASVGIYGVVSYSVAQRARELGVRMALGATSRDLRSLVLRQGAGLIALGLVGGALLSLVSARLLGSLLYQIEATDPATFAVVALVLVASALAACYLPARRAGAVDPMTAIRVE